MILCDCHRKSLLISLTYILDKEGTTMALGWKKGMKGRERKKIRNLVIIQR